jgi:hypothetical protein
MRSSIGARSARAAAVLATIAAVMLTWTPVAQAARPPAQAARPPAQADGPPARADGAAGWRIVVTRHYDGPDAASGYSAIVAPGHRDAWAFGGTNPGGGGLPVALRWNGARWRSWPLPAGLTGFIGDASAPSGRDIWAVSYATGYVLHWNGTRWLVAKRWQRHSVLTGVTAVSPADVWIFGTTTAGARGLGTWHFDGRSWAHIGGRAKAIYRASAVSRRDIWAVAATSRGGYLLHYDGRAWRHVDASGALARASLDDVLAVSRHDIWVVGNLTAQRGEGRLLIAHFDGHRWTRKLTARRADTGRLAPDGSGGVWITADNAASRAAALIGHLSRQGQLTWAALGHGLGSGVSDIAVGRGTSRVWLSGGFLTRTGGNAAIWSRGSDQRSGGEAWAQDGPLVFRSGHLDLAALLQVRRMSTLPAARAPSVA